MTDISEDHPVLSGRYELHRRIARGGMAEVFLARDQLLDRPVAVKVLFPQYAADPTFVARFRREAQAAANLNHPSIVAVYDWGHQDETYFIVMEYVEGQSLAELLADEGPLNVSRSVEIVRDVAAALGFAHQNGTVHRDVKPGNIMITNDDQVKVADFGIARAFGGADDQLTQTGSVMGTASYFSPEQAQGKQVDPRSDLYSLGVVLFEMVTGQTPFSGESPVAIAYKHVQETPPRPSKLNPEVTPAVEGVIARLLAKSPDQRYSAAADLRDDLKRVRQGQPLAGHSANGDSTTAMMADSGASVEPASRAVIDTTRAVPASVASGRAEPVEEFYEQPNRTGVFLVMLLGMLLVLVVLLVVIFNALNGGSGSGKIEVDDVIGRSEEDAKAILEEDGKFEVVVEFGESEDAEPNEVFAQDPAGGTEVEKGSTVTITLAQAEETVVVPDVVNKSQSDATTELEALGFDVKVETEKDDSVASGDVISTSPAAGEEANKGNTITITVSEGSSAVTVPRVQSESQAEARQILADAGFTNVTVESVPDGDVPEGQAIGTNPPAGSSAEPGSRIRLRISAGSEEAVVPDVEGMTVEQAEAALRAEGFNNIVKNRVDADDPDDVGKVISQNPSDGTSQKTTDPVTLTIGQAPDATTTTETTEDEDPETTVAEP